MWKLGKLCKVLRGQGNAELPTSKTRPQLCSPAPARKHGQWGNVPISPRDPSPGPGTAQTATHKHACQGARSRVGQPSTPCPAPVSWDGQRWWVAPKNAAQKAGTLPAEASLLRTSRLLWSASALVAQRSRHPPPRTLRLASLWPCALSASILGKGGGAQASSAKVTSMVILSTCDRGKHSP